MNSVMLIGRILFAFMFIASGLNHFTKAEAMAGYAAYKKVPNRDDRIHEEHFDGRWRIVHLCDCRFTI
jgi:uncharacterized membrane protein YphA (DoxX/SURF4 family)